MLDDLLKDFNALRLHYQDPPVLPTKHKDDDDNDDNMDADDDNAMDMTPMSDDRDEIDHALLYLDSLRSLRLHLQEVMRLDATSTAQVLQSGLEEERQLCETILQFSQYCLHYEEIEIDDENGFEVGVLLLEDYLPVVLSALLVMADETVADLHHVQPPPPTSASSSSVQRSYADDDAMAEEEDKVEDEAVGDMMAIFQLIYETMFSVLSSTAWNMRWSTFQQLFSDLLPRLEDSFHDHFFVLHPVYRLSLYAVFVGLVEHIPIVEEEALDDECIERMMSIVMILLSTPTSDKHHDQMIQSSLDCLRAWIQHPILSLQIAWSSYMSSLEVLLMRCLMDSTAPTTLMQSAIHVSIDMLSYLNLKEFPDFADAVLNNLVGMLHMPSLSRETLPHVFSALSEMTMYFQAEIVVYLPAMFEAMHYIGKDYVSMLISLEAEAEEREEDLEEINAILYAIMQCYSTIIMEVKECDQCEVLKEQIMPMYVLLKGVSRSEYWSIAVLQAAVGLIGDIVSALGSYVSSLYMDTSMLSLIQVALTSDEKTKDIAMTTSAIITNTMNAFDHRLQASSQQAFSKQIDDEEEEDDKS